MYTRFERSCTVSKLSQFCLQALLKFVIRNFGVQVVPAPPILKALPKIFAHSDKTVRAEGANLATVLYQYIGPGIEPWLADLKPVQIKELKDSFETLEKDGKGHKTLKPEKMTRAQSREVVEEGEEEAPGEPEGTRFSISTSIAFDQNSQDTL